MNETIRYRKPDEEFWVRVGLPLSYPSCCFPRGFASTSKLILSSEVFVKIVNQYRHVPNSKITAVGISPISAYSLSFVDTNRQNV